jgi:6,7-dimethyl-8-ribityllumazine synthase
VSAGLDHTGAERTTAAVDGHGRRVALVCSEFNRSVVDRLEHGARTALVTAGVAPEDVVTVRVPGALEIPIGAMAAARSGRFDAVVGIGAVMRGATYHFEVVSDQSAAGLLRVALDTGVVVTNGIITVDTVEQADERAGATGNKGAEAAVAALRTLAALEGLSGDDAMR